MTQIILATKSPYRKKFFEELDIEFTCEGSDVNEDFEDRPQEPSELVKYLAKLKSEAVAKNHTSGIIIGFDSVGDFHGEIFEKPKSREEAANRIRRLSEDSYKLITGMHMINLDNGKVLNDISETIIWFRKISEEEIEKYLNQDPNFNTYATGFDPQGYYSCSFASKIEGSYNNFLIGLPCEKIMTMLFEIGYELE